MEFEETSHSPVDPEVRAYVYSLVSAVCSALPNTANADNPIAGWDGRR